MEQRKNPLRPGSPADENNSNIKRMTTPAHHQVGGQSATPDPASGLTPRGNSAPHAPSGSSLPGPLSLLE